MGGNKTRKRVEIEEPGPATTDGAGRAGRRSVWKERKEEWEKVKPSQSFRRVLCAAHRPRDGRALPEL